MSAVEDRLAAIIAEHALYADGVTEECKCEWDPDYDRVDFSADAPIPAHEQVTMQHAAHVAAVIASSADLAVIELPTPNEREDDDTATTWGEPYNDLQVGVHDEYADQVQVWVDYEPIEPWSPHEAEEFASHLLAAAKRARQEAGQ